MLDYDNYKHHPLSERIVDNICNKIGTDFRSFFRVHVAYYICQVASTMRTGYYNPGSCVGARPVNMFAINLAPSGFGKGYSTTILEEQVFNQFREVFLHETWPIVTTHSISKVADYRARKAVKDPEMVQEQLEKDFQRMGEYEFSFTKPTEAAIVQLRNKLLLANIGAINLQVDEIGANLFKTKDALPSFLELYDGKLKNNLTKNTSDSIRSAPIFGTTPTNAMFFGVPTALLDNGKNEEEFTSMMDTGYARRCFFGYLSDDDYATEHKVISPQERLKLAKTANADHDLQDIADYIQTLADPLKAYTKLATPDDTALLLYAYMNDCNERSHALPLQEHIRRYELERRYDKTQKLAAAYAFIDSASQVEVEHMQAAIAVAEESGAAFQRIMHRDLPHVKLAKHLAIAKQELTKVTLREQLPFFKGGTKQSREEMLNEAIEWGYTNNIAIKRRFASGVEFYSGQYLKSNDLTELRISLSRDIVAGYQSEYIPWEKLGSLAKHDDIHWINHHLENGYEGNGYRDNENCLPGFNLIVFDVDDTIPIRQAMLLLKDYKALYYTTKRHTKEANRYRIILPINYTLELSLEDFEGFMQNMYEWLPFDADEATGQRSRKWLSNKGTHHYTDGWLFDALPFIPRTTKQAEYSEQLVKLENLGGLERWFVLNTAMRSHNRNNNLLRYALMLVDGGMDVVGVNDRLQAVNNKLDKPMSTDEITRTIMKTVTKRIQKRDA